ncbi:MAG: MFS transporter [Eubacteriales bacterium]
MQHEQTTQEQSNQKRLIHICCYGLLVSGACSVSIGPLIPFLRESYGFHYGISGMLLSALSFGNLITILLAGVLPAYLGRRKSIQLTGIWMIIGYLLLASGVSSPLLVMLACLMIGLARGGNSTFSNTMMSTLPGDLATKGYNASHGSFALGALLAPLLLLGVVGLFPEMGWRLLTVVMCVFSISHYVLLWRMPLPEEPPRGGAKQIDKTFLRDRRFWMGAAMLFFYISTEYAISGWLVTYFQDTGILDARDSQLMSTLFWATMFAGRMVGGQIVGKIESTKLLLIDGVGLVVCFTVMFLSRTPLVVTVSLAGVGLFMATIYPTAFAIGSRSIRGNDFGCSMMSFIGTVGGIVTPALVGLVATSAGIYVGMGLVVCTVILLLLSIIFSVSSLKKDPTYQ